jgi:hypothetical protein
MAMSQARNALGVMELSLEDFENSIDRTWHEHQRNRGGRFRKADQRVLFGFVMCPEMSRVFDVS